MDNIVDPFKVYVRVRPLLEREKTLVEQELEKGKAIPHQIVTAENNIVYIRDPNNPELYGKNIKAFPFDKVFTEKEDNKIIFQTIIKKLVDNILQGYNSTALAYGVTGAGKTHTMFGDMYRNQNQNDSKEKGICMYAVDYLFSKINREKDKMFTIKISYLEIYNEQVIDLLISRPSSEGIMIVEDPNKGVLVPDLSEIVVKNSTQVFNYIIKGNARRTKGATGQNQFSSRSHAILGINIEQCGKSIEKGDILVSKMLLVDLAGSERGGKEKGIRREEGGNINRSLLALGNCINILSDKTKKGSFVPYRDSKLTRLLKDSLGGNTATIMIACVSPFPLTYEETHSTLKYASRANNIEKKITKNFKEIDQCTAQYREMISSLRAEITRLKEIIRKQHLKIKNKNGKVEEEIKSNPNSDNISSTKNEEGVYEEFFGLEENTLDNSITKDQNQENTGIIINFSADIYDNILHNNLNDLSDNEFEDLERKLDNLYYDKINIEEKIKQGVKNTEINEKYAQIKNFYTKFIDVLNDKLAENTEQNMIIKFNLKELLESTQQNSENLHSVQLLLKTEKDKDEISRLTKEKKKLDKEIKEDNSKIEKLRVALKKNIKMKSFLKKSLLKFISNTQIGEMKDLRSMFTRLSNEKRELEIKTQKYQEYFNSVLHEKEKKTHEIFQLSNELEKTKILLLARDKKIAELESKIAEIESSNSNLFNKPYQSPLTKSMLNFMDDCDSRSSSKDYPHKIHHRSTSIKNLSRYSSSASANNNNGNNYISINLNSKIPTVTAFIKGGDIYSHDASLENSISNLKYNLTVKTSKSPMQKRTTKSKKLHKITPSTSLAKKTNGKNSII